VVIAKLTCLWCTLMMTVTQALAEPFQLPDQGIGFSLPAEYMISPLPAGTSSTVLGLWKPRESTSPSLNIISAGSPYPTDASAEQLSKQVIEGYQQVGFQDAVAEGSEFKSFKGLSLFSVRVNYSLNSIPMEATVLYLPLEQLLVVTALSTKADSANTRELAKTFLESLTVSRVRTESKDANVTAYSNSQPYMILGLFLVLLVGIFTSITRGRRRTRR
jgi:hypothetical protein